MADILYLPDRGRLLVCTDLQGNLGDYERMESLFHEAWTRTPGDVFLLFTGDLIHGPYLREEDWPDFLGDFYRDDSGGIVERFARLREHFAGHVHALLGNHEHGHVGGPHTAKFAEDEVIALERVLGPVRTRALCQVLATLPLVAVAPCGVVFTHGAPAAEIESERDILDARLTGHAGQSPLAILDSPVVGKLLWARSAAPDIARRFLAALGGRISIYGHDVIPAGFERIGDEQMIVSTSFGVEASNKVYLDLDLGGHYQTVHDLCVGREIVRLYPEAR